jgi:hypothetical protein
MSLFLPTIRSCLRARSEWVFGFSPMSNDDLSSSWFIKQRRYFVFDVQFLSCKPVKELSFVIRPAKLLAHSRALCQTMHEAVLSPLFQWELRNLSVESVLVRSPLPGHFIPGRHCQGLGIQGWRWVRVLWVPSERGHAGCFSSDIQWQGCWC